LTEKHFNPKPKVRNCNTVRCRCLTFLSELRLLGYTKQIPLATAIDLFSKIMDQWDRLTLKAYFGTIPHRSIRKYFSRSQYQSGVVSNKTIELSQEVSATKGYLEKMGLATVEKNGNVWFLVIQEAVLVPQLFRSEELVGSSMPNISISPIEEKSCSRSEEECEKPVGVSLNSVVVYDKQKNNNSQVERDIFHNTVMGKEELKIMQAKPTPEPSKVKID